MALSLHVYTLGGECSLIEAARWWTISDVKGRLEADQGIPSQAQRLLSRGVLLDNSQNLDTVMRDESEESLDLFLFVRSQDAVQWLAMAEADPRQFCREAPDWARADAELVLAALCCAQNSHDAWCAQQIVSSADSGLFRDRTFVLAAVPLAWQTLRLVPSELLSDAAFVVNLLQMSGAVARSQIILLVPPSLWHDTEFVLESVKHDWRNFQMAASHLRSDREVVQLAVLLGDWRTLEFASEELRSDPDFVLKVLDEHRNARVLERASVQLRRDRDFILGAMRRNPQALAFVDRSLREDRNFVLESIRQVGRAIEYVPERWRDDKEMVLTAVEQNWRSLRYAGEESRVNSELLLAAVRQSGQALELAAEERQADRQFIAAAIHENPAAMEFVSSHDLREELEKRGLFGPLSPQAGTQHAVGRLRNGAAAKLRFDSDDSGVREQPALLVSTAQLHGALTQGGEVRGQIVAEAFVPETGEIISVPSETVVEAVSPPSSLPELRRGVVGDCVEATLKRAMRMYSARPCLGCEVSPGVWRWLPYRGLQQKSSVLASLLHTKVACGATIGICGENSVCWITVFFACLQHGLIAVPLSLHLAEPEMCHIVSEANMSIIFASDSRLELCRSLVGKCASLVDVLGLCNQEWMSNTMDTSLPNKIPTEFSHDTRVVFYTSGSTGMPKGVAISSAALNARLESFVDTSDADASAVGLIDSPFAVTSATCNLLAHVVNGGRVAVYADLARVFEVARAVEPTSLSLVPELWGLLYRGFLEAKLRHSSDDAAFDTQFASALGRRIRNLSCGGAQPNSAVMTWLRKTFVQARIIENYGSTELGSIAWTTPEDGEGLVHSTVDVKLLGDDGSMHDLCLAEAGDIQPQGEICAKTRGMLTCYFNRPDLTCEAFTSDGYFRTGDIGKVVGDGRVRIVGRIADTFKLSDGEFVCPATIENVLVLSPFVSQAFVYGNSKLPRVVAIIVPSKCWASIAKDRLLVEINAVCSDAGLRHGHTPCAIHISPNKFDITNGLLTESQKLCRPALQERFVAELRVLADMCSENGSVTNGGDVANAVHMISAATREVPNAEMEEQWSNLHVDSMVAIRIADALRHELSLDVPIALILGRCSLAAIASAATGTGMVHGLQNIDWSVEQASLGTLPSRLPFSGVRPVEVLVTGATGFLGGAVLHHLLSLGHRCVALVRESDFGKAHSRLLERMLQHGYWKDSFHMLLSVVHGDITLPWLGLANEETFDALALRLGGGIIHCAAEVRHLATYRSLRDANVTGTQMLLRLASRAACRIVHVSTIDAVPLGTQEIWADEKNLPLSGGYAQSKWVAEHLVKEAAMKCGKESVDAVLVRAGLLTFNTVTGAANVEDWLTRFVVGAVHLGGAAFEDGAVLHVTPVDFAASALRFALLGAASGTVWHVPCAPLSAKALLTAVSGAVGLSAGVFPNMSDDDWLRCMRYLPHGNPLAPLRHVFLRGLPAVEAHQCDVARSFLAERRWPLGAPGLGCFEIEAYVDLRAAVGRYIQWLSGQSGISLV